MNTKEIQAKSSYLSFLLYKEIFAINVENVLEVLEKQSITYVPDTPDYIVGVVNFRGEILPVLESRLKFNMPARQEDKYVIVVLDLVLNGKKQLIGAIVDSVVDVIEIGDNELQEIPEMGSGYRVDYIKGMLKSDKGFIMILNIHEVFSNHETDILSATVKKSEDISKNKMEE
jgi:purine-binding chemotaxis protein CheW